MWVFDVEDSLDLNIPCVAINNDIEIDVVDLWSFQGALPFRETK
jgi:hypothetical protein